MVFSKEHTKVSRIYLKGLVGILQHQLKLLQLKPCLHSSVQEILLVIRGHIPLLELKQTDFDGFRIYLSSEVESYHFSVKNMFPFFLNSYAPTCGRLFVHLSFSVTCILMFVWFSIRMAKDTISDSLEMGSMMVNLDPMG